MGQTLLVLNTPWAFEFCFAKGLCPHHNFQQQLKWTLLQVTISTKPGKPLLLAFYILLEQ